MAVPTKDSLLVPYATNFSSRVTTSPLVFGLSAGQATALSAVVNPYLAAAQVVSSPGNRSTSLVNIKNQAKTAMLPVLREMYGLVQANLSVADDNKLLLGVTLRAEPSPIPVPGTWPGMDILSTIGRKVKVHLHDNTSETKRAKPPGVVGAVITSYHGPNPENPALYKWEGSTNRSTFEIEFPESVAPGTVVYLSAMWLNAKNESGPACPPQRTTIQFVQGMGGAPTLSLAA
jgi:hypothetical protein